MTDPIRDAPERLVAADRFIGEAGPEYAQAREAARAVLAAPTPEPDTDAALKLAAIIREVGSINHRLGAAALAEAILAHPAAREVFASLTMPAGGAAMSDTARAVLQRHVAAFRVPGQSLPVQERIAMAEEALAAPTPPADGEVEKLAQWLEQLGDDYDDLYRPPSAIIRPQLARAAALLREARPQSVPVAQRPWEQPGWCDAKGRCWFGAPVAGAADAGWILRKPSERLSHQIASLPHWAIPIPTTTKTND